MRGDRSKLTVQNEVIILCGDNMVFDVMTYNGEREMLKLHLSVLDPYVDRFIICESRTTFSGNEKPSYFFRHTHLFKPWWKKITYYLIQDNFSQEEIQLAENSPNTKGAAHWKTEFLQKERIKIALKESNPRDQDDVYVGDVDEIWKPQEVLLPKKLKMRVYAYYLNNQSNEEFWGTLVAKYGQIKNECLNHMRSNQEIRAPSYGGWHFTSMGGLQEVERKLHDSYTDESYYTADVKQNLANRVEKGIDYLGRPFVFKEDTTEWPDFLKKHKLEYTHLCL